MDDEQTILRDFLHDQLPYLDAVQRLEKLGFDAKDAETLVNGWIAVAQNDDGPDEDAA